MLESLELVTIYAHICMFIDPPNAWVASVTYSWEVGIKAFGVGKHRTHHRRNHATEKGEENCWGHFSNHIVLGEHREEWKPGWHRS